MLCLHFCYHVSVAIYNIIIWFNTISNSNETNKRDLILVKEIFFLKLSNNDQNIFSVSKWIYLNLCIITLNFIINLCVTSECLDKIINFFFRAFIYSMKKRKRKKEDVCKDEDMITKFHQNLSNFFSTYFILYFN